MICALLSRLLRSPSSAAPTSANRRCSTGLSAKEIAIVGDIAGRNARPRHRRHGDWRHQVPVDRHRRASNTGPVESLQARMIAQTEKAIAAADVLLFVIDAREGVTPGDEIVADALRRKSKPVLIARQQDRRPCRTARPAEAYRLGFGDPIALSAEHGLGIGRIVRCACCPSPKGAAREEEPEEIAGGRPPMNGSPTAPGHCRAAQRRQIEFAQSPDRRGARADKPRGGHHARCGGRVLELGRARNPSARHRRFAPARPHRGAASRKAVRRDPR